jgi:RHS repeat-associated protein
MQPRTGASQRILKNRTRSVLVPRLATIVVVAGLLTPMLGASGSTESALPRSRSLPPVQLTSFSPGTEVGVWAAINQTGQGKLQPVAGSGTTLGVETTNLLNYFASSTDGPLGLATTNDGEDDSQAYLVSTSTRTVEQIGADDFQSLDGAAILPNDQWGYLADGGFDIAPAIYTVDFANEDIYQISSGGSDFSAVAACPDGNTVVATDSGEDELDIFSNIEADPTSPTETSVSVGSDPVAVTCSGGLAYVANEASGTLTVVNVATASVTSTISVGSTPDAVAVGSGNVYAANRGSNTVSIIAIGASTVKATASVGMEPDGIAISGDVYVSNYSSSTVTVLSPAGSFIGTITGVPSPEAIAVVISPPASALSPAEAQGLANLAEGCVGCFESDDLTQVEDSAIEGDDAELSDAVDVSIGLDVFDGDPVNTATGNFTYQLAAISDPGLGPPLQAALTYNSYNSTHNLASSSVGTPDVGYNWTTGPGVSLAVNVPATGEATITQEDGAQVVFTAQSGGSCPAGLTAVDPTTTAYCAPPGVQAALFNNSDGTWTFDRFNPTFESFVFSSSAMLTSISDGSGNTTTVHYLTSGSGVCPMSASSCVKFTAPSGRYILFEENSSSQVTTITDTVHVLTLSYCSTLSSTCAPGDLSSAALSSPSSVTDNSDTSSHTWTFTYDETNSLNALATLADPNATANGYVSTTNTYDDSSTSDPKFGWVTSQTESITSSTSATTSFNYTGLALSSCGAYSGSVIVTDPNGNESLYGYSCGALDSKTTGYGSSESATTLYQRDPSTLMLTEVVDPNGNTSQFSVDGNGRITGFEDAIGNPISYSYGNFTLSGGAANPAALDPTLTVNASGTSSVNNAYNNDGTLHTQVVHPDYPTDNPANALTTTYFYSTSGNGQLTGIEDPLGRGILYFYDPAGDVTQHWLVPSYSLDSSDPSASTTELDTCYSYDTVGRLLTSISPNGNVGSGAACSTATTDITTVNTYNALDETTTTVHPPYSGTSVDKTINTYDLDGNLTVTEENAAPATYVTNTYNRAGWLCWSDPNTSSNSCGSPPSKSTSYGYDGDGNTTSVTDGNSNTTTYAYADTAYPSYKTSSTLPDTLNSTTYSYDEAGNLAATLDPLAQTVSYGYDADNRLCYKVAAVVTSASCTSPPSGAIKYTYTPDSQRKTLVDSSGTTTYSYDTLGRLTSVTDGNGNVVSYEYDGDNEVTCIGYPVSGAATCPSTGTPSGTGLVAYGYDGAGRITTVEDWNSNTTAYTYDADSNVTKITYPSSTIATVKFTYDNNDTVLTEKYKQNGASVTSETWTPNGHEQFSSVTEGGVEQTYAYDNANRVTSAAGYSYAYSGDGQLCWELAGSSTNSCASAPTGSAALFYNADSELTHSSVNGVTTQNFEYNADGERCWQATGTASSCTGSPTSVSASYGWDAYGNLCWVDTNGVTGTGCTIPGQGVVYTYNGDGLRMKSLATATSTTTTYSWDSVLDSSTPHLLTDGSNAYIYGPDVFSTESPPIEQIALSGGSTSYLNYDPMGVRNVFSPSGTLQVGISYQDGSEDAYGSNAVVTTHVSGVSTPFQYKGGYKDPLDGLIYFINRYYDSATGQFLSLDSLVKQTGQPYDYAGDDPVNFGDSRGLECEPPSAEGSAAGLGISGAAGEYDIEELAQLVYQHIGEGDIPGTPTLDEIQAALENGVPQGLGNQNAVQFEYNGVRVIVNESIPTRSTAYYPGS